MVTTDEKRYQVEIRVAIRDKFIQLGGYQGLTIEETVQIEGGSFLELAAILQQFHQVAEKLKESE
jgi:hypothetical protein